jgi:hypothetical protein
MNRKIIAGCIGFGVAMLFSGCVGIFEATPPNPFETPIQTGSETLTPVEKKKVYNNVMEQVMRSTPYHRGNNNCLMVNEVYRKTVCYSLNDDTTVKRTIDFGRKDTFANYEQRFVNSVNKFQDRFMPAYTSQMRSFIVAKSTMAELEKNQKVIDTTNLLSLSVVAQFKLTHSIEYVHNVYEVATFIAKPHINRTLFDIEFRQYSANDVKVTGKHYNFIPSSYSMFDKSISVDVNGDTMTFTNKTGNFINVESVTTYYNGDVEGLKDTQVMLAPHSKVKYNLSSYKCYEKPYLVVKNNAMKVDFGFAISYYNQDTNHRTSLYKTTNYSMSSFK